ncbi:MAG: hypothetical protein DCC71_21740 [Proteobacteria bacterium]|nr:MAG: hypothetical protein DCC71_21740 [Pseudomonadota bacterium]
MPALVVDVVFRGKVLETVAFDAPTLRIGRMPENDVVLDNLGVSRFHARLHREDDRVVLEDAGSGNGCLVNGERVEGRRPVQPGDRISIGKHELVVRRAIEGDPADRRPARRKADAWDGGRTYVLGMPGGPRPGPESALDVSAETEPAAAPMDPPASARKEPTPMTPPSAPVAAPLEPALDSPELDFDFVGSLAADADAPATTPLPPAAEAPPTSMDPAAPALHAGFIVQRQGKLERVTAWTGDVVVAGRSSDCDVVLAQDEVSRRHARFERVDGRYEVRDLGSVNGTFVNGRRIECESLCSGDVVQIEGFQLTFVLDREPIDAAVAAEPAAAAAAPRRDETLAMTMLQEQMPHRPGFTELLAKPAPGAEPSFAEADVEELAEADLLPDEVEAPAPSAGDGEADAKPDDAAAPLRGSSRATSVQDLARTSNPNLGREPELCFELRVRMDLLPPALRRAFEEAGASELVLPAELRLRK